MNSAFWEEIFSKKEWGKYPSENLIRFIARNFYNKADRKQIRILELGLGTGANLWFCAREGFRVSGIEWSKTGVERFLQRLKTENLEQQVDKIVIGDYEQKLDEFENESFDAVIDCGSLCCNSFEKTRKIFLKALEKLKNGGKFYSSTISTGIYGYDESKGFEQEPQSGIYTHLGKLRFSTLEKLNELYSSENFKYTQIHTLSIESADKILDKLFIVEGIKDSAGGGDWKKRIRGLENEQNEPRDFFKPKSQTAHRF